MDKKKIDRCRALVAAIYNGSARRRDEVELCELLPEALDAAERSMSTKPLREKLNMLATIREEIGNATTIEDAVFVVSAKIKSIETGAT